MIAPTSVYCHVRAGSSSEDIKPGGRKTPPFSLGKALIIGNTRPEYFTLKFIMCTNYTTRQE